MTIRRRRPERHEARQGRIRFRRTIRAARVHPALLRRKGSLARRLPVAQSGLGRGVGGIRKPRRPGSPRMAMGEGTCLRPDRRIGTSRSGSSPASCGPRSSSSGAKVKFPQAWVGSWVLAGRRRPDVRARGIRRAIIWHGDCGHQGHGDGGLRRHGDCGRQRHGRLRATQARFDCGLRRHGDCGRQRHGDFWATAGTATAGDAGTATAGDAGTATAATQARRLRATRARATGRRRHGDRGYAGTATGWATQARRLRATQVL